MGQNGGRTYPDWQDAEDTIGWQWCWDTDHWPWFTVTYWRRKP